VGKAFANQQMLFSGDLQALAPDDIKDAMFCGDSTVYLRVDLAKKFGIHSAVFMPTADGVLEVGSTQKVASVSDLILNDSSPTCQVIQPPAMHSAMLGEIVEKSCGGCFGIEWMLSENGCLVCKSYYNPPWRIEAVQKKGLQGLYTSESSTYTFLPGEGLVGKAFANQQMLFSGDLQALAPDDIKDAMFCGDSTVYLRVDLAKKFGIHSAVFMPTADGVLEVGSTQKVASVSDFLSGAKDVLQHIVPESILEQGWVSIHMI